GNDVLIINAIYKTNRFFMPLIAICGIDRFGSTYPLAFVLVYSETEFLLLGFTTVKQSSNLIN
ncbi:21702_t:CDS:1, partial [Gigaspora rosea]